MYCLDCGDESCLKYQTIKFNEEQRFEHKDRVTNKVSKRKIFKIYLTEEEVIKNALHRKWLHRYREYPISSESNFDEISILKLLDEQGWECNGCGLSFKHTPYQIDHKQPLKLGGTNSEKNIQLLCKKCNREKWDMEYSRWRSLVAYTNVIETLTELAEGGY